MKGIVFMVAMLLAAAAGAQDVPKDAANGKAPGNAPLIFDRYDAVWEEHTNAGSLLMVFPIESAAPVHNVFNYFDQQTMQASCNRQEDGKVKCYFAQGADPAVVLAEVIRQDLDAMHGQEAEQRRQHELWEKLLGPYEPLWKHTPKRGWVPYCTGSYFLHNAGGAPVTWDSVKKTTEAKCYLCWIPMDGKQ